MNLIPLDWKAPDYDAIWQARVAMLRALREEPERWAGMKEHYKSSPGDFINDWGVTFDPRNVGTALPTTLPFVLFKRQGEFIEWLVERWRNREGGLVEKSRDMGVSWLCCAFACWLLIFWPGSVAGFGSRKEDLVDESGNPDSLFWKIRSFIDMLPVELRPGGGLYDKDTHAPFMRVRNPDPAAEGATIIGEAGDNIGRGGRTTIYFKDESAHYMHPESIDAALSQNTNIEIDVSTPNGEGNPFWQKRHGGKVPVFVFDWQDDPRKDRAWYERQANKMTKVALAAEVDRDYSGSISNSYIAGHLVTEAMRRGPMDVRPMGGLRVGIDVARFGDDSTVMTFRRGRVVLKQVSWAKCDIVSSYGRCVREIGAYKEKPEQIAVDVIGLGAGLADLLRAHYDKVIRVPEDRIVVDVNSSLQLDDGANFNLRAFMWAQMLEWLPNAALPNDKGLRGAMTSCRYGYRGGLLLLESKDDMKKRGIKSPDEADSLALTFAIPTKAKPPPIPRSNIVDYRVDSEMGM